MYAPIAEDVTADRSEPHLSHFLSHSISHSVTPFPLSVCLSLSRYLSLALSVSLDISIYLSLSLSLALSLKLHASAGKTETDSFPSEGGTGSGRGCCHPTNLSSVVSRPLRKWKMPYPPRTRGLWSSRIQGIGFRIKAYCSGLRDHTRLHSALQLEGCGKLFGRGFLRPMSAHSPRTEPHCFGFLLGTKKIIMLRSHIVFFQSYSPLKKLQTSDDRGILNEVDPMRVESGRAETLAANKLMWRRHIRLVFSV